MSADNSMSANELVEQANRDLDAGINVLDADALVAACDAFYLSGFADEVSGDVGSHVGHFHRVHRWVVRTDDHGFKYLETFDSEEDASRRFAELDGFYAEWLGDEEE